MCMMFTCLCFSCYFYQHFEAGIELGNYALELISSVQETTSTSIDHSFALPGKSFKKFKNHTFSFISRLLNLKRLCLYRYRPAINEWIWFMQIGVTRPGFLIFSCSSKTKWNASLSCFQMCWFQWEIAVSYAAWNASAENAPANATYCAVEVPLC